MRKQIYKLLTPVIIFITSLSVVLMCSSIPAWADGGTSLGTPEFPHMISTCNDLQNISLHTDANYVLTANIDCSSTTAWNGGDGFIPIGNFTGVINGKGHTIAGLHIDQRDGPGITEVGIIANNQGVIENLSLSSLDETYSQTSSDIGGLVGVNTGVIRDINISGTLTNQGCANSPGVSGNYIGLLAGDNNGQINNSVVTGSVVDESGGCITGSVVGGFIGMDTGGVLQNIYSQASVTTDGSDGGVGGLIGMLNNSDLTDTYSSGSITVNGTGNIVGGLIGEKAAFTSPVIRDSFSVSSLNGSNVCNGLCGGISGSLDGTDLSGEYYDQTASNILDCDGGGNTSCTMNAVNTVGDPQPSYFYNNSTNPPLNNWDFSNAWQTNLGLPTLQSFQDPSPGAPTSVVATPASSSNLNVSWQAPSNSGDSAISSYYIEYEVSGSGDTGWSEINTPTTDTSFSIPSLLPNTKYDIEIVAENTNNNFSFPSSVAQATTLILGYHSISTCEQLQDINQAPLDNYEIINNIDCSDTINWNSGGGFIPIGSIPGLGLSLFEGVLYGNNYSITGLYTNPDHLVNTPYYDGLFSAINGAEIQDLTLVNPVVTGNLTVASNLVGVDFGGSVITNVHVKGGTIDGSTFYAGGLVGASLNPDSITLSSYEGNINNIQTGGGAFLGGLVGLMDEQGGTLGPSTISNDYTNLTISDVDNESIFGGLLGVDISSAATPITISNSYSSGTINDSDNNGSDTSFVGGLVGMGSYLTLNNTLSHTILNTSDSPNALVAGIVGFDDGTMQYSQNYFDAALAGTDLCSIVPSGNCTAVNSDGLSPDFFYNNSTNPPLNNWDFSNIWQTTSTLPIFGAASQNISSGGSHSVVSVSSLPEIITRFLPKKPIITHSQQDANNSSGSSKKKVNIPGFFGSNTTPGAGSSNSGSGPSFSAQIKHLLSHVPAVVLDSFPYALFVCLLLASVLAMFEILWQTRKLKNTQVLLAKQKAIAEERDMFWHLAANYLRAPVTLLVGGAELLSSEKLEIEDGLVKKITKLTSTLQSKVSGIVRQIENSHSLQKIFRPDVGPVKRVVRQFRFWIPVISVGLLAFCVDYLAKHFRHLNVGAVAYATQILIFCIVAFVLYRTLTLLSLLSHKRQLAELLLKEQAEDLDKAREELITTTNQELSSAVTEMQRLIDKLPDHDKSLPTLREGSKRLKGIIDTFQLVVNINSGLLDTNTKSGQLVKVDEVINSVVGSLKEAITAKKLNLKLPSPSSTVLPSNVQLVHQMIYSILMNAIEFSPEEGTVSLIIRKRSSGTAISISDQGEGISDDQLEHIFQPFTRADGSDALQLNHDGLGMNLYIDKMIMDKVGGSIAVRSKKGHGTVFTVTWPSSREPFAGSLVLEHDTVKVHAE